MLFLHDVWVNWFEGEENGYNVCHFHEWRKEDSVELLDQVPLLKVQSPLYDYIENDLSEPPKTPLESVFEKSYIRKNHERRKLEYCFVVTDGIRIIAVDTIGYSIPVRKSRLIPRQEQLVYEMVKDVKAEEYEFSQDRLESAKEYHILSLPPQRHQRINEKRKTAEAPNVYGARSIKRSSKQGGDCVLVYGMESAHVQSNQTNVIRRDLEYALQ